MKTKCKIVFNKKFNFFECLTAVYYGGQKLQKFGNDYNLYSNTRDELIKKVTLFFKDINIEFEFI